MNKVLTPPQIEAAAHGHGLTMAEVCRRSGVNVAKWQRWKSGKHQPSLAAYTAIINVLNEQETNGKKHPAGRDQRPAESHA